MVKIRVMVKKTKKRKEKEKEKSFHKKKKGKGFQLVFPLPHTCFIIWPVILVAWSIHGTFENNSHKIYNLNLLLKCERTHGT